MLATNYLRPSGSSAAELRARSEAAFQQLITASWELFENQEAVWSDLICGLSLFECISERAAFRLHELLGVPIAGALQRDPRVWKSILESRGFSLDDTIGKPKDDQ